MASSSRNPKEKESFEVQLVINEVKQPYYRPILVVAQKNDPASSLSIIPAKLVMVQDVKKCYNCKIGAIGDMEIQKAYDKLCENGILKEEFQIVERKGLTRALDFLVVFKLERIRIVLSRIHDGCLWLEYGLIKISKRIKHRVTRYLNPRVTKDLEE